MKRNIAKGALALCCLSATLDNHETAIAQDRHYKLDYLGYPIADGPRFEGVEAFYERLRDCIEA